MRGLWKKAIARQTAPRRGGSIGRKHGFLVKPGGTACNSLTALRRSVAGIRGLSLAPLFLFATCPWRQLAPGKPRMPVSPDAEPRDNERGAVLGRFRATSAPIGPGLEPWMDRLPIPVAPGRLLRARGKWQIPSPLASLILKANAENEILELQGRIEPLLDFIGTAAEARERVG